MRKKTAASSLLVGMQYEYARLYNCPESCIHFRGSKVFLRLKNREYKDISMDRAVRILKNQLEKGRRKGKGYIGSSMSVNAKEAYKRGLKPLSKITATDLKKHEIPCSVGFFKWIVKNCDISPNEVHHTSAARNETGFYDIESVKKTIDRLNLSMLEKIYRGEWTMDEAKAERGIRYARVRVIDTMLGECISQPEWAGERLRHVADRLLRMKARFYESAVRTWRREEEVFSVEIP